MKYFPFLGILCLASGILAEEGDERISSEKIVENYSISAKSLASALGESRLWEEAGPRELSKGKIVPKPRERELLTYLKAVEELKPASSVPILISHITFDLNENIGGPIRPTPNSVRYPVFRTLRSVGLPAISGIVERLKTFDADEFFVPDKDFKTVQERNDYYAINAEKLIKHHTRQIEYRLLINCMVEIYTNGDFRLLEEGLLHTSLRLEQEIKILQFQGDGDTLPARQLQEHLDAVREQISKLKAEE